MIGTITGELEGGFAVTFPAVSNFKGVTKPATIWMERADVEILPDEPTTDTLHITTP